MADPTSTQKQILRAQLRERLRGLAAFYRVQQSLHACEIILRHLGPAGGAILFYMPLVDELDVRFAFDAAIRSGMQVALPRFVPGQEKYAAFFVGDKPLISGAFGILEPDPCLPVALNQLDFVVVPGLGFDVRGRRLGRGKGFYDRLLSEASGVKCGVCFDEQIVENIPAEPHDICVDFIATPTRWLDCRGAAPETQ